MQLSTLFPNITPRTYAGVQQHRWDSLFGIELELENVTSPAGETWEITPAGWTLHEDASLRNGIEFVTVRPYGGHQLEGVIESFYDKNLNFTSGPRTSTHIHVNMSDATVEELRTMMAVVYTIEDAIYACTEESRKWGGYSVALAEMRPQRLRNILNAPTMQVFTNNVMPSRNNERYYGFNCNVSRHGTAEFRYFPGGPTQDELVSWVDLVSLIKRASKNFTVQSLNNSIGSPHDLGVFLTANFGEWAQKLIASRSLSDMYSAFEAVMAMALDDENLERSGGVVHITPSLMRYVETTLLSKNVEAIDHLRSSLPRSMVLGENDWVYYLSAAQRLAGTKKSAVFVEEYSDPFAYTADLYPDHDSDDELDADEAEERERQEILHEERQMSRIDAQIRELQSQVVPTPAPSIRRSARINEYTWSNRTDAVSASDSPSLRAANTITGRQVGRSLGLGQVAADLITPYQRPDAAGAFDMQAYVAAANRMMHERFTNEAGSGSNTEGEE